MIKLPLVGPAYKLNAQSMSCQNCINWYPQTIEYPNGSRVAALMPTPGLKKIFEGDSASVRCLHVLSNGALLAVIGKKLYHSKANRFDPQFVGDVSGLGTIKAADNGIVAIIVNGTYSYSLDMKTLEFKRLSGSTIPRSTHVLFLDGRFVVNKANTGQFYWSDLYSNKFDALSYATAESSPDKITALVTFNRELWIFGAQTVERYYSSGSQTSPYARLSGGAMAFGCTSPDSIVALATGVIWLSLSEFGGHQIVMSGGGVPERISTHAIEEEIASYIKTSDAIAYAYQQEGHVFYVISFPSASTTFCFDVSTGLWHQRSYASQQGLHERHRSQHHAFFNGIHIVGDYKNGKLYQLDKQTYTDDGDLILRERTAQAVITDGKLTRFNNLEIVCEVGFEDRKPKPTPQPPVISCEGATNSMYFFELLGVWELYVDDVFQVEDKIPMLIDYIESQFAGTLLAEFRHFDGEYWRDSLNLKNLDNVNHRIKLVPVFDDGYTLPEIVENPTFTVNDDGSLTFCLSEFEQTNINCDGATTNAILAAFQDLETFFTVEVNGEHVIQAGNSEIPIDNDGGLQGWFMDNSMNVYCYYLSNDVYNLLHFQNETQEPVRISIRIADGYPATFRETLDNPNPTVLLSEPEGFSVDNEQLYRKASFCLVTRKAVFYWYYLVAEQNITTLGFQVSFPMPVVVYYPDGLVENVDAHGYLDVNVLSIQNGIYRVAGDFENLLTDAYFCFQNVSNAPPIPIITSSTRLDGDLVEIIGTAKPNIVIALYFMDGDDEEIAFAPVDSSGNFLLSVILPPNFSGYIRGREGGNGSAGAKFSVT